MYHDQARRVPEVRYYDYGKDSGIYRPTLYIITDPCDFNRGLTRALPHRRCN